MLSLRFVCLAVGVAGVLGMKISSEVKIMKKLQFYPQTKAVFKNLMERQPVSGMKSQSGNLGDIEEVICYVSQPGEDNAYVQQCGNWATKCVTLSYNFDDATMPSQLYACADESVCRGLSLFCDQLVGFDGELCTVDCCYMNECNPPQEDSRKISQRRTHDANDFFIARGPPLRISRPVRNQLKLVTDGLSCYVSQDDQDIIPEICPAEMTRCAVVSFDVTATPAPEHEVVYGCATDDACQDPTSFCERMAQQLPLPISNCSLTCCSSTDCNQPSEQNNSRLIY